MNGVNSDEIDAIIISSVVPPVMPTLERMCQRYFGLTPLVIGPGVKTGMDIKYDNPREVGADRIVNAVAAYEKFGGPVIIIDFGTAIIDLLRRRQERDLPRRCYLPGHRHLYRCPGTAHGEIAAYRSRQHG